MENYKLGLIGYPLGHSLSPVLHKAAFKDLGLNGSYELMPTKSEDIVSRIKELKKNKFFGFNVTIPLKVPITLFLSKYDEFVNMTGAVNTIKIEENMTLYGFNTDVWGFVEAIPKDINLKGKKAAVIGTGGASRAICAGLYTLGIGKIDIYTRNVINSKETMETFRKKFDKTQFQALQTNLMETLEDVDILVNTSPIGMKNFNEETSPVSDSCIESLKDSALVYDIVYNPIRTALISKAIKYKKRYVTGLDMLTYQAQRAFEIWTGKKPDFKAMKIAALEEYIMGQ
ncbi:shikimate dehydrogenase [bacterium]|nr:shikimate dehydrogenase [bacterium]